MEKTGDCEKSEILLELGKIKAHSKCLISGGYFIVLEGYKGLVLATSDYFTCRILKSRAVKDSSSLNLISFKSPQFPDMESLGVDLDSSISFET